MNAPLFRKLVPAAVEKMADANILRDQAAQKLRDRRAAEVKNKTAPTPPRTGMAP